VQGLWIESLEWQPFKRITHKLGWCCNEALRRKNQVGDFTDIIRKKKTIAGEDVYQDVELDSWKLDSMISEVQKENFSLVQEQRSIVCQVAKMQKGDGMLIWPKPILHPIMCPPTYDLTINVRPCGFCNKWYHS